MLTPTNRSGTMDEQTKKKNIQPHLAMTYEFNSATDVQSRTSHLVKGKYSFETCVCVCVPERDTYNKSTVVLDNTKL